MKYCWRSLESKYLFVFQDKTHNATQLWSSSSSQSEKSFPSISCSSPCPPLPSLGGSCLNGPSDRGRQKEKKRCCLNLKQADRAEGSHSTGTEGEVRWLGDSCSTVALWSASIPTIISAIVDARRRAMWSWTCWW